MNTKLVALLAVIVVVAAGVGVAYCVLNNNDNNKDSEPTPDYKLLDNNNNIKKGLTFKIVNKTGEKTEVTKTTVTAVKDGYAYYTEVKSFDKITDDSMKLAMFLPDSSAFFDYTKGSKEGVTVVQNGNEYTINGTISDDESGIKSTMKDLKITYDGTDVTQVSGGFKSTINASEVGFYIEYDVTLETKDNALLLTGTMTTKDSCEVSSFFEDVILSWSDSNVKDITTPEGTVKYGNVEANAYKINGSGDDGVKYENVKVYVYKGFILFSEGKIDGVYNSINISVYLA